MSETAPDPREEDPGRVSEDGGGPLRVELLRAGELREGDWLGGHVSPPLAAAPTFPVLLPFAGAIRISAVRAVPGGHVRMTVRGRDCTPLNPGDTGLVIRGLGSDCPPPALLAGSASRLRPGDWLAGDITQNRGAGPVRVFGRAFRITAVDRKSGGRTLLIGKDGARLETRVTGQRCLAIRIGDAS